MPETQRTSKHTPSTPHSIPSNPQPQHKRKREHDGDSGENIRKVEKRSKVLHNRSDDMENIQTRSAEVARAVLSEEPAKGERNGHDALEAKVARNLEISVTKLAKREMRKREREEGLNPKSTQNLNGERNKQDQTKSSSSIQDEDGQKTMEDRAIVKEKNKKEGKPANVESTWKTSEPIGGRFIDAEPLFSADEK